MKKYVDKDKLQEFATKLHAKQKTIFPLKSDTATKEELAVERARITNLATLGEGSTTGDAELIDIRVGADGVTYPTAGDAVRGQIGNINDALDMEVVTSANRWNPAEETVNVVVHPSTGADYAESGYTTSGYIAISYGDTFRWDYSSNSSPDSSTLLSRSTNVFRVAEYDSNKSFLQTSSNWASLPYSVQNSNTAFIRVSVPTHNTNSIILNNSSTAQIYYIDYRDSYVFQKINDIEYSIANINPAEVILPSKIYGVTGQEINIYKENLMFNNRLRSLAYIHTRLANDSIQNDERTIWNPSTTILAETNRAWEVMRYGLDSVESKTIKECIVPKDTGSGSIKVLIIGDSKVDNGYVSYHFLHNFDDDDMSVTLLGSKYDWTTDNRNEGWGGKTAEWFCTNANSPLSNNGACDFANYLSVNSIDTPDYVFINLGTNDCASVASGYDTIFVTYITQMIESIHAVSNDIVVIVGMCEGVSTVLDDNNAGFNNWDLNQKISNLHKATITAFDNRENENIYVCPMYMGMDLQNDYTMTEVPLSARDGDVNSGSGNGKTRMQITDRVHQNEVGYWKNADYMYAVVKYIVAKSLA